MTVANAGFVTGGTWCVDHNMTIPAWPREETATAILAVERQGGGSACNFAVDMRRLSPDMPVATIGLRGADADGAFLLEVAQAHGIDTARFGITTKAATHRTLAFTARNNARRTHLFEAASADLLTPDHFDFTGLSDRMLHLGLPGTHAQLDGPWGDDPNGWLTVLRRARAGGLSTNMEVMTIPKDDLRRIVGPCLPHLDHLVVNDYEIGALAGRDTLRADGRTDLEVVELAARQMMRLGTMKLVVVHFPEGAVAVDRADTVVRQPSVAVPTDAIVGTNGAGDAFAAGFFCARAQLASVSDSLALGHAAAAASLRSVDTTSAMVSAAACLALAGRYGWRDALPS